MSDPTRYKKFSTIHYADERGVNLYKIHILQTGSRAEGESEWTVTARAYTDANRDITFKDEDGDGITMTFDHTQWLALRQWLNEIS